MNKIAITLVILILAGLGFSYYRANQPAGSPSATAVNSDSDRSTTYRPAGESSSKTLEQRITSLENQLATEMAQRRQMQAMLEQLLEEGPGGEEPFEEREELSEDTFAERREEFRQRMENRNSDDRRVQRLVESGFDAQQAAYIVDREKQVRLQSLDDRWEYRRQEYLQNPEEYDLLADNPLRAELGEQAYEQYLEANNRSTSVSVRQVLADSPAALSGLQAGDEIIGYNGQRVFNMSELNAASVQGDKGAPVTLEVMRNGSRIQLTVERGPLGVSSRRRGRWR